MNLRSGLPFVAVSVVACGSITDEFGSRHSSPAPTTVTVSDAPPNAPTVVSAVMDTRPVQTAATPPPPISGGTVLVTRDGTTAVAADPDRDRVSIVSLAAGEVMATVLLTHGDEPGRVVEDANRRVHVALRRGGAIATIDIAKGTLLSRRAVCGTPRGVAYEAGTDLVHVACSSGELVSLPAAGGDAVRRLRLDVDLRDVVVRKGGGLLVSRFKTGEMLSVDASGSVVSRAQLHGIERSSNSGPSVQSFGGAVDPIEPAVAWRTVGAPDGTAVVLHQYGLASTIKLAPSKPTTSQPGNPVTAPTIDQNSPYATPAGSCGGLVQPGVTQIGADGSTVTMGAPLVAGVLTVDASVSPDGAWVALAHAGLRDPNAPVNTSMPFSPSFGTSAGVTVWARDTLGAASVGPSGCATSAQSLTVDGQATAVAFNPGTDATAVASSTWFVVQSREPASLTLVSNAFARARVVSLGGASVLDTGHEMFHRDAGGGIACASCHAEGGEDGRVWRFDPIGDRRTQAVHVGLKGTEPFHWDGDMGSFDKLVDEVMVRRMGGAPQVDARKNALSGWLFTLTPPAPIVTADDPRAVRGRALFMSSEVGCSGCHSGAHLTSNQSVYVGTSDPGHVLQVPSLHGIGYRAPFIHNGCAVTLRDRFDPSCGGGDAHGRTSQLGDGDVADLIAYLESL